MSGPWERYQSQPSQNQQPQGPWQSYSNWTPEQRQQADQRQRDRQGEDARRRAVQGEADNVSNNILTNTVGALMSRYAPAMPLFMRSALLAVGGNEVLRGRARTGIAQRDAAADEGFLDRSGSILERGLTSMTGGAERFASALMPGRTGEIAAARAAQLEQSGNMQVQGETTWDQVKADPLRNTASYVLDTMIGSAPEMALTAIPGIGMGAESMVQTGRIGQQRAENDGRLNATIGDIAVAAPFGIGATLLERAGIDRIFGGAGSTVARRIAGATGAEAVTEALQSGLEYTGGTAGTEKGFNATEALDQMAAGAVGGAGMGGAIRTGIEVADRVRRPRAPLTESDRASPIENDVIAEGKAIINEATGAGADNLQAGNRVEVTMPNGSVRAGVIDAMPDLDGSAGIRINFDDGTSIEQPLDMLADAGVDVRSMGAQADAIDAALSQAAQSSAPPPVTASVLPSGTVNTPAPTPAQQFAPQAANVTAQPSGVAGDFNMGRYLTRNRGAESSGNDRAQASTSSAFGRYQFTKGTWRNYYRRVFGDTGESDAQILSHRANGAMQDRLMSALTNDNIRTLSRAGLPVTDGTVYLSHFLGPADAVRVLRAAPGASVEGLVNADSVAANRSILQGKTAGQVIAWASRKMGGPVPQMAEGYNPGEEYNAPDYQAPEPTRYADIQWDEIDRGRNQSEPIPLRAEPQTDSAVTATGREVPVRYAVAELSDLVASNDIDGNVNQDYPAERQPRQRDRAASRAQISNIAANLNPRLLARSPKASDGAPIISPEGVVESGNGRTIALQQAYAAGGEQIDAYRSMIESEGFDTAGMAQPVLVRVRDGAMSDEDVRSFVVEANTRDNAAMSGIEEAYADAQDMPGQLLDLYRGGDVDAPGNRDFVRGFMQALVPTNDQGRMVMADGSIAKPLMARIEAALLVRAFGRQPFVEKLVDATDTNIRAIGKALTETASLFAKLREAAGDGRVDPAMDIGPNIAEAVEIIDRARREKRPVADLVGQHDIFSGETVAPLTEAVLRMFFARPDFTKPVSQARLVEALRYYAQEAEKAAPGGGLFGESTKATPDGILNLANARQTSLDGSEQPDLLRQPAAIGADGNATANPVTNGGDGGSVPASSRNDAGPSGESVQARAGDEGAGQSVNDGAAADVAATDDQPALFQSDAPAETGGDMRGEAIDGEWHAFAEDSGSLGIPRADMPQIKAEHRGAMVNFLNARGIEHGERVADPADFKPTQAEFSSKKVEQAKEYEGGDRAILVSRDGHVLDGHHQWLAARDKGDNIRAIQLDAPIRQLLNTVQEFPSATTADGATEAQADKPQADVDAAPPLPDDNEQRGQAASVSPSDNAVRIEDFGEKLEGARKDYAQVYQDRMQDAALVDVATEPLSKSWPEPDYEKLLADGVDAYTVAWARAVRDEIPPKPRSYGVKSWSEGVIAMRDTVNRLLTGDIETESLKSLASQPHWRRSLDVIDGRRELYEAIGHSRSLKGITLQFHHYSLYKGRENVRMWAVEQKAKASAFSNWPRELATADTKSDAIEKFQALVSAGGLEPKKNTTVRFDIYSRTGQKGFFIGKKVGKNFVDLKQFDTAKEARDYKVNNYADLVTALDAFKDIPSERKEVNAPRIGINHRNGIDVTPEMFSETFGFRGVQFGNYVEGPRRQADLNEAYDALMDLAGVIGVPAKALSLNGDLGLAFGARGKGGKNAAAAHFEPGTIVINLTKNAGAGSLAHEWWHSLDNYFSRMRSRSGYMTDSLDVDAEGVRPEMVEAFRGVMRAIRQTAVRERSRKLDSRRTKGYWSTDIEMSARAFESYVIAKLADEQFSNDYLANVVSEEAFDIEGGYPYPTAAEIDTIRAGFDEFFRAAETRETERGVALQSRIDIADIPVVAELTGKELGDLVEGDMVTMRDAAIAWYRKNLLGKNVTMADGVPVSFTARGMRETTFGKGDTLLRVVPAIRDILKKGQITERVPGDRRNIVEVVKVAGVVMLDGERRAVAVSVRQHSDNLSRQYALSWDLRVRGQSSRIEGAALQAEGDPDIEVTPDLNANIQLIDEQGNNAVDAPDAIDEAALTERLRAVGLADKVALRVVESLNGAAGDYGADGMALIRVARDTSQAAEVTVDHEIIHAMRGLGILTKSEWSVLSAAARRDERLMASVRRRYADLNADGQLEEAVADMYARRAESVPSSMIGRLFQRIADVIEALRNAWHGDGMRSARGVMDDIEAGTAAERSAGKDTTDSEAEQGVKQSRPLSPEDTPIFGRTPDYSNRGLTAQVMQMAATLRNVGPVNGKGDGLLSRADAVRVKLQDRMLPVLRLQDRIASQLGRDIAENENPYLSEELMTGRIGARIEKLGDEVLTPMFNAMSADGVTIDELETYLYARHAPERNARIAKINPEMPDGGSGMSDIEALALMNRMKRDGKIEALERVAVHVDKMLSDALQTRLDAGLLSAEEAKAWSDGYEHYVPLRGRQEVEGDISSIEARINRSGSGVIVKGKESKRAYGRRSKADNILSYAILQAQEAIMRAETNAVAQSFLQLAEAAPDADLWTIDKIERRPQFNDATGLVSYRNESRISAEDAPYTVVAKVNGEERRVTMNRANPDAVAVASSMRNLTAVQFEAIVKYLGSFTRFFSAINTRFSPPFIITNAIRDLMTAATITQQYDIPGFTKNVLRDWRHALTAKKDGDGDWSRWRREFELAGGKVYFNEQRDLNDIRKDVEKRIARARSTGGVKLAFSKFFDGVEVVNDAVERAVRLSVYKNAREAGRSKAEAASMARNVTVNFTRRGDLGPVINAGWAFFNASTQGSANLVLAAARSKKVRRAMYGFVVAGFLMDMLNALISDDDEDGQSYWDKLPDHEKVSNLILILPGTGGRTIKLPLAYGLNALFGVGRNMSAAARGAMTPGAAIASTLKVTADAFNPIGNGGSWWNIIAPTALDPFVDVSTNRDFADKPIQPEQNPFEPDATPSSNYFPSVNSAAKWAAQGLNSITGGDVVVPGAMSISPEVIEYMTGYFTGGAGRFVQQVAGLGLAPFDPDREVTVNNIPFLNRVTGVKSPWVDRSQYFSRREQIEQVIDRAKEYQSRGMESEFQSYVSANERILSMEQVLKASDKDMRDIRRARRDNERARELGTIDQAAYRAERDAIESAERQVVLYFNTQWSDVMLPDAQRN